MMDEQYVYYYTKAGTTIYVFVPVTSTLRNQFELCVSLQALYQSACLCPSVVVYCRNVDTGLLRRSDEDDETLTPKPEHERAHLKKIND